MKFHPDASNELSKVGLATTMAVGETEQLPTRIQGQANSSLALAETASSPPSSRGGWKWTRGNRNANALQRWTSSSGAPRIARRKRVTGARAEHSYPRLLLHEGLPRWLR